MTVMATSFDSYGRELEDGDMTVGLVRVQPRRREVGPIRRIRPNLWLKAERIGLAVKAPTLPGDGTVEEIAGIELQTRLVGHQRHHATRRLMLDACDGTRR